MVKPLIITNLAEKGSDETQASACKLLAQEGYDPEMGSSWTHQINRVKDKLAELLPTGELKEGRNLKIGVKLVSEI